MFDEMTTEELVSLEQEQRAAVVSAQANLDRAVIICDAKLNLLR